jgi:hypothetical protein
LPGKRRIRYIKELYGQTGEYELELAQAHIDQVNKQMAQVPHDKYREASR